MSCIPLLPGAVSGDNFETDGALPSRCVSVAMLQPHRSLIRMPRSCWAVQFIAAIAVLLPWPVQAQNSNSGTTAPTRPSIMFNRWEEDWSVLADPRVPREPLDSLKYIPLTLQPTNSVKILLAIAEQWRQTTADAVYVVPNIPLPGTAGRPGRYTGTYGQARVDWTITPQLSFALEAVYFNVSDVIVRAGGHNSTYLGVQIAYGW